MSALRPASKVMRLERLGASHQTRLSFMRVLLRKLRQGNWRTKRTVWQINAKGIGHAVYQIAGEGQVLSLVAFAHDLPDDKRSDRVIAEAWDATFTLVDGVASPADIERLAANVPRQEAGRVSDRELVLSRANRSVRLWAHVVDRLSKGKQPDPDQITQVGYLMRTTAVYGSGKFGAADFASLVGRGLLDGPFRAEMLSVWLIRTFVVDLAEHMAAVKGGANAVPLAPKLRRKLGIGNSTGLGMAPFLVHHPRLLNAWITARETALARVRALPCATPKTTLRFRDTLRRARALVDGWHSTHAYQAEKIGALGHDLEALEQHVSDTALAQSAPWDQLYRWAENALSAEGQELLVSLMLEPHGDLIDDLADAMACDETRLSAIDGRISCAALSEMIERDYDWALSMDHGLQAANARFWYVSQAKLEPRLGERETEPGSALEQPLDIARAVAALHSDLAQTPAHDVADFLAQNPAHRHMVRRVQLSPSAPYAEIRDNLISADLMPIDMLRCKLAFFGATKFDPRSDRWLRITMFQGAPYPDELATSAEDDWALSAVEPALA